MNPVRRPPHFRNPKGLVGVTVFRHQRVQLFQPGVRAAFGLAQVRVGMHVHDVEMPCAAQAVNLLDEVERHARHAAERDAQRRVVRLDDLIGAAQDGEVVRRVRILPERIDVRLVPDFQNRQTLSVMRDHALHVIAPSVQVLVGGIRPFRRLVEDRQQLQPRRLAGGHDHVVAGEVPDARLPLDHAPVEVAAHPARAHLANQVAGGGRRLVPRQVRARAVGAGCRHRRARGRSREREGEDRGRKSHHVRCSFLLLRSL